MTISQYLQHVRHMQKLVLEKIIHITVLFSIFALKSQSVEFDKIVKVSTLLI